MKSYEVVYKANGYQFKDVWKADSKNDARKCASDDYRQNLTDFQGIISVTEI